MANILFVYRETENQGIEYLCAYLKQRGHSVGLVYESNFFNNKYINSPAFRNLFPPEDIVAKVFQQRPLPDLVAFSTMTADYQWSLSTAKKIKAINPDIPIIFGGIHPTLVPEETINNDGIDMVCIGEGEDALLELADSLSLRNGSRDTSIRSVWFKTKDGRIIKNPVRPLAQDLDKYPFPDHDLFARYLPYYGKYMGIITSRGCPYSCTYCSEDALKSIYPAGGKYVRRHSVGNVIAHLKLLKSKYNTRVLCFNDDVFTADKKWLYDFLNLYKKEIRLPFTCLTHPRILDQDDARLLKEAGCSLVMIGVQAGSEELREKVLNRKEKNADIIQFSRYCHEAKLNFSANHIFSLPYETLDTVRESAALYNIIRPSMIDVYDLLYFPKARIVDIAIEAGILGPESVRDINQGRLSLYQLRYYRGGKRTNYDNFALFFSSIPLLPKRLVDFFIQRDRFLCFNKIPLIFVGLVKIALSIRTRTAYFQMNFIKTVFWHLRRAILKETGQEGCSK